MGKLNYNERIGYESAWLDSNEEKIVEELSAVIAKYKNSEADLKNQYGEEHTTLSDFLGYWGKVYKGFGSDIVTEEDHFNQLRVLKTLSMYRDGIKISIDKIKALNDGDGILWSGAKEMGVIVKFGKMLENKTKQIVRGDLEFIPESQED